MAWHCSSDGNSLEDADLIAAAALPATVASHRLYLGRRPTRTRLANEADQRHPVKFKKVAPLDREALVRRMNEETAQRWEYLWKIAFPAGHSFPLTIEKKMSRLTAADADIGIDCGILELVTHEMELSCPTMAYCIPFTVMEDRAKQFDPLRPQDDFDAIVRRFICWTKTLNFHVAQQHYEADLPGLKHPSAFLQDLRYKFVTTADLAVSFYQHQLTERERAFTRFYDLDGRLCQMKRGLMGHCCFVEIQQITTEVLSGNPEYCRPEYSLMVPCRRVWVDNVKLSGSEAQMKEAGVFLDSVANEVGATWNSDERETAVQHCSFIGAEWNHEKATIQLTKKFLSRLPKEPPETQSLAESERMIGRLVHAAGMLRLPLGQYYYALKWYRRRANAYGRGAIDLNEQRLVPPSVRMKLKQWLHDARRTVTIPHGGFADNEARLFSDASLHGWGAVLILANGQVFVAAGQWAQRYSSSDINALEAAAAKEAVSAFRLTITEGIQQRTIDAIRIVVDNTSVKSTAMKGSAKEQRQNDAIVQLLSMLNDFRVGISFEYVESHNNPADEVSRGKRVEWAKIQAEGSRTGDGGGGRAGISRVCPTANEKSD